MIIPEQTISEIKSRVDIVNLVREYLPIRKVGANYVACCPFHNDGEPSFTVSPVKQFYHCFGCGAHGDQIDWLVNYLGMPWHEAVASLAERAGIALPKNETSDRVRAKISTSKVLTKAARWMHRLLLQADHAIRYLVADRKVTPDIAKTFMIGLAPKTPHSYTQEFSPEEINVLVQAGLLATGKDGRLYAKLGGRLIFPIFDAMGHVIGFSGRALSDVISPKYMNSPDSPFFSKRREIFRPPDVRKETRRTGKLIVVEGYFDVIALYSHGFTNAVALMGTAITKENIHSLFSLSDHVVFCFDGDKAGRVAAWAALTATFPFIGSSSEWKGNRTVSFAFLPDGLDPDEFVDKRGAKEFGNLIDNANPSSRFFLEVYKIKRSSEPAERHTAIIGQAVAQINQIKDIVLKNKLASDIAAVFDVPITTLKKIGRLDLQDTKTTSSRNIPPPVRQDALESSFLAGIIRRPWDASLLPEDVELTMPGATEIIDILRHANIAEEDESSVKPLFFGTPYLPLVERLLSTEETDDTRISALRIELAWIQKTINAQMASTTPDSSKIRELLTRKVNVQERLEELTMGLMNSIVKNAVSKPEQTAN